MGKPAEYEPRLTIVPVHPAPSSAARTGGGGAVLYCFVLDLL